MSTDKTKVRRLPERATTESEIINAILDEGILCHVGYIHDDRPVVIPTLYVRDGTRIILHGSTASGISRAVRRRSPLSITVTHLDGLVVARSGFHSSANYRSVVIHGLGSFLEGEEHLEALDKTVERLIPGRLAELRSPTDGELRQTASISVPLDEASAKVRTGPPNDDESDLEAEVWAGVVPMSLVSGDPVPAPDLKPNTPIPDYLRPYRRSIDR